ncbi:MAG TPA: CRISPR-associated protein Cas4 [Oligoflexia bacterium]|nr:CRISPR-associated protein Cas4 [Oligoflexia bacterium]HMP27260.1 CRISPR-associated protein Cas4 [Oligoflexia bacterium]
MLEEAWIRLAHKVVGLINEISILDTSLILLCVIGVMATIALDGIITHLQKMERLAGLNKHLKVVGLDGSKTLPAKTFISEKLGLSGRPDAIIQEGKWLIPVEIKPLTKKFRDRHIAQLLVYMRLIEEEYKKRPPHGYLIIGEKNRLVKIENTSARQLWLDQQLTGMKLYLTEKKIAPAPQFNKCKNCDVRSHCAFDLTKIKNFQK